MKRDLVLELKENPFVGCNNGETTEGFAYVNGKMAGKYYFCRCGNGCNGTDKIENFKHFRKTERIEFDPFHPCSSMIEQMLGKRIF